MAVLAGRARAAQEPIDARARPIGDVDFTPMPDEQVVGEPIECDQRGLAFRPPPTGDWGSAPLVARSGAPRRHPEKPLASFSS